MDHKYIKFDTNQELRDFIPIVEKAGFKPNETQTEYNTLNGELYIELYNGKEYCTLESTDEELNEITQEQFKKEFGIDEWPKIFKHNRLEQFTKVWKIDNLNSHFVRSTHEVEISLERLENSNPWSLVDKEELDSNYTEYIPQETIEVKGKKYNLKDVEERLASLETIDD